MAVVRFYKRPTVFRRRLYDPLIRLLILRFGLRGFLDHGGEDTVEVLCVQGRRSGRWHRRPVGVTRRNGSQYLVGFYGQTDWALNLRAEPRAFLQTRERRQAIRATELSGAEKEEFLRWLVTKYRFFARAWLKVHPDRLTNDALTRLMHNHPVFCVERRDDGHDERDSHRDS